MNDKSHYTIGKKHILAMLRYTAPVFLRANDKQINGISADEINRSPFYGTTRLAIFAHCSIHYCFKVVGYEVKAR